MADTVAPSPERGAGWVVMTHPDLTSEDGAQQYSEVTRESFDLVWKDKGWTVASVYDPESNTSAAADVVAMPDGTTKIVPKTDGDGEVVPADPAPELPQSGGFIGSGHTGGSD